MSYLHDKNKKNKKIKLTLVGLFLMSFLFFSASEIKKLLSPSFTLASRRIDSFLSFESIRSWRVYFSSKESLQKENLKLTQENILLKKSSDEKDLLELENQKLRNIFKNYETHTALTQVKTVGGQSLYGVVVLNRGGDFSFSVGDYLLGESGGVVGIIKEVREKSSKVLLLYATQDSSNSYLIPANSLEFSGEGYSEGALYALIPHTTAVSVGDIVTLKDSPTLPVGKVAEIFSNEKEPFKKILIRTQDTVKTSTFLYVSSPKN